MPNHRKCTFYHVEKPEIYNCFWSSFLRYVHNISCGLPLNCSLWRLEHACISTKGCLLSGNMQYMHVRADKTNFWFNNHILIHESYAIRLWTPQFLTCRHWLQAVIFFQILPPSFPALWLALCFCNIGTTRADLVSKNQSKQMLKKE